MFIAVFFVIFFLPALLRFRLVHLRNNCMYCAKQFLIKTEMHSCPYFIYWEGSVIEKLFAVKSKSFIFWYMSNFALLPAGKEANA